MEQAALVAEAIAGKQAVAVPRLRQSIRRERGRIDQAIVERVIKANQEFGTAVGVEIELPKLEFFRVVEHAGVANGTGIAVLHAKRLDGVRA